MNGMSCASCHVPSGHFVDHQRHDIGSVEGAEKDSQDGALDKKTKEPLIFTSVALEGTKHGMATDINGYYAITKVAPGTYSLVVSSVGYEKYSKELTLDKGDILTRNIYLEPSSVKLDAI